MYSLREMINALHTDDESFLPYTSIKSIAGESPISRWIDKYYLSNVDYYYRNIDDYISNKYGLFIPIMHRKVDDVRAASLIFRSDILFPYLLTNIDTLNHIIELSEMKYNPINNYDKDEVVTTEYIGSESSVDSIGESRVNVTNGERITTDTNKKSPYNDDTYYNDTELTSVNGGSSDTKVESAKEDSRTRTFNGRKDIVTTKTSGNIGVTTTTMMMGEAISFWSAYNIVDFIMNKFVAENCILLDE